jgi:hypothetical protein
VLTRTIKTAFSSSVYFCDHATFAQSLSLS